MLTALSVVVWGVVGFFLLAVLGVALDRIDGDITRGPVPRWVWGWLLMGIGVCCAAIMFGLVAFLWRLV